MKPPLLLAQTEARPAALAETLTLVSPVTCDPVCTRTLKVEAADALADGATRFGAMPNVATTSADVMAAAAAMSSSATKATRSK